MYSVAQYCLLFQVFGQLRKTQGMVLVPEEWVGLAAASGVVRKCCRVALQLPLRRTHPGLAEPRNQRLGRPSYHEIVAPAVRKHPGDLGRTVAC